MDNTSLTAPVGQILPFMFDNLPVRGVLLRLKDMEQYIPSLAQECDVSKMLTEMLAASVVLVNDLKHKANVTLQIHSQSDVALLVSQCDKDGGIRAYANAVEGATLADVSYGDIIQENAMFAVSVDQNNHRYQSLIGLNEKSVARSVDQYFNDSVQLPTYFRVFTDPKQVGMCGALFLQVMPSEEAPKDDWQRLSYILDTVTTEEALPGKLTDKDLLRRLFAEDTVRTFEQKDVNVVMPNIKERMEKAIRSMGVEQAKALLEEGPLEMTCEFSGQSLTFGEEELRNIFGTLWHK